jgi:hypothetical protein
VKYTTRTVRCNEPGLSQEQALSSLYDFYGNSIRVASAKRRGDSWVVTFKQRVSDFPPKGKDEGPPDIDDESGDEPPVDEPFDNGPPDAGDDSDEGDKKPDPQAEILHLLTEIAAALGIGGGLEDKLPPEGEHLGDMPPGPDAGLGPMDGPPGPGGPPAVRKPTKLKPGEVLPSQTAIGSPAFASANTITVQSGQVDPREYKASHAQADLERGFEGYKVKQLKFDRTASVYHALLSTH